MPVPDHLCSEDLQHGHLVRPVLHCLVSTYILVAAESSLAAMLQQLNLIEKHVVTLVVALRRFFLL